MHIATKISNQIRVTSPARTSFLILGVCCYFLMHAEPAFAGDGWWNGTDTPPFAGGVVRRAFCDLAWFIEGTFGGMVMAAAGVVAVASAALGSLKQMQSLMIAGIGAATITAGVSLYFGDFECANKLGSPSADEQARQAPNAIAAALAIATGRALPEPALEDDLPKIAPEDASEPESESDGDPFSE